MFSDTIFKTRTTQHNLSNFHIGGRQIYTHKNRRRYGTKTQQTTNYHLSPLFSSLPTSSTPQKKIVRCYSEQHEESFEDYTARFVKFFDNVDDLFELQRGLNNAFGYDLVPSASVIEAALKAARRVNDYPTAVRILEGLKAKTNNDTVYKQYLEELAPLRAQLGVETKEELGL